VKARPAADDVMGIGAMRLGRHLFRRVVLSLLVLSGMALALSLMAVKIFGTQ
jgi:hypothetical protein